MVLESVLSAVRKDDVEELIQSLNSVDLGVRIEARLGELYMTNLMDQVEQLGQNQLLGKELIVEAVASANRLSRQREEVEAGVAMVNKCLSKTTITKHVLLNLI